MRCNNAGMATLFDYVEKHGDAPFDEEPFNEADNLALCQLTYCELAGIVPALGSGRPVTMARAWRAHAARRHGPLRQFERLFSAMARSQRFGNVRLIGLEERFDPKAHEQFGAYTALLPDGTAYIAFRGTGHHIAGWRENFMMSYMVVAAQLDAQRYLDGVARITSGALHVGGHSKGGNLAAYAAAFCEPETRERICDVWCNDSPGFVREVVDFDAFAPIADRMHLFVPEFCVVAGIMEQVVRPAVVASAQRRHRQHDAMSWRIDGTMLERADAISPECRLSGRVFHRLVYSRSRKERKRIVNRLFDAISQSGIESIGDFARGSSVLRRLAMRLGRCGRGTCMAAGEVMVGIAAAAVSLPRGVVVLLDYPHIFPALVSLAGIARKVLPALPASR